MPYLEPVFGFLATVETWQFSMVDSENESKI